MKKIIFYLATTLLLISFQSSRLNAATMTKPSKVLATNPAEATEAKTLLLRLDEIASMDKTEMPKAEKKDLRKEVRSIKTQLNDLGHGVYLSGGAIIIIILLLILLL